MTIVKPPVKNVWADTGDKTEPTGAEVLTGWPASSSAPSRQRFNWILNFCSNGIRYLTRRGLADYDAAETYLVGDRIIGDDGFTYKCIQTANINHLPSSSPTWWELWGDNLASNFSLGSNGYVKFPKWLAGGLIIQWVRGNGETLEGSYNVNFPIAFPNHVHKVFVSTGIDGPNIGANFTWQFVSATLSAATLYLQLTGAAGGGLHYPDIFAIGD
jgi:hypothetical protein